MTELSIRNFTRQKVPAFPYARALEAALPGWELSLVFTGRDRARNLNIRLRGKDYVPNVLSYESGRKSGEIVICLEEAKRQAPSYLMPYQKFVAYLFIHGLMHLKGHPHGATMEAKERLLLKRFAHLSLPTTNGTQNRNRN